MSESAKLLRGTMVLTLGQVVSYSLSFARNIILARLLSKADFGIATLFAMTISVLEIAGRMSFGQQIVQSKDGSSDSFQATSHAFQVVLALAGAVLIFILSHPMAQVMKVPHLSWAFAALAFVPLTRAFEHLDLFRQQRDLNYFPTVLCEVVPQTIITIAAWPLAVWFGDFRVIVCLMIVKAVLGMFMTHLLAKRSYQWAWHPDHLKKMWGFGWPLLINGLLIFASQQADQVLIGAVVSLDNLATYALAFSLISIPWTIFAQVGSPLILSILSRAQDDHIMFCRHYRCCAEYAAICAVTLTVPLIVLGEQIATFFYGYKYTGAGVLMALLGAASAVRFIRLAPSIASMARADTMNQLYSNIWRGMSLPMAAVVAAFGGGVALIAACALGAELIATVVSILRLRRFQRVPLRDTVSAASYVFFFTCFGLSLVYFGAPQLNYGLAVTSFWVISVLSLFVAWKVFPESSRMLMKLVGAKLTPKVL